MPEDYMEAEPAESPAAQAPDESSEDSNESAVLVNKSLAPDAKPGDTITVKVVHVYEDELSVKAVEAEPEPEEPTAEAPDGLEPAAAPGNDYME